VARLGREGPEPEPPEKAEPRSSVFNVPGLALGVGELPGGAPLFKPFSGLGAPMQNPMATRRVKALDPQGRGPVREAPPPSGRRRLDGKDLTHFAVKGSGVREVFPVYLWKAAGPDDREDTDERPSHTMP